MLKMTSSISDGEVVHVGDLPKEVEKESGQVLTCTPTRYDVVMNPSDEPVCSLLWRDRSSVTHKHVKNTTFPMLPPNTSLEITSKPHPTIFPKPSPMTNPEVVDLTERLSKYLSATDCPSMDPRYRGKERIASSSDEDEENPIRKEKPRTCIQHYNGMSAFLYTPGDPAVLWFCHSDGKMHTGIKTSDTYVSFLQVIATHDADKEHWGEETNGHVTDGVSTSHKRVGRSLPCTPRHRSNGSTDQLHQIQSMKKIPSLLSTMDHCFSNLRVSWYGITNGKAITACQYDPDTKKMTIDVAAYIEKKCNVGMHIKVPVHLPSQWVAQEGGFRKMHPGEAGRRCTVFVENPMSHRDWKKAFGGHDYVYVETEHLYCIDEAHIDMDHQLDPQRSVVTTEC